MIGCLQGKPNMCCKDINIVESLLALINVEDSKNAEWLPDGSGSPQPEERGRGLQAHSRNKCLVMV
jgi:hypothetical protein